MGEPSVNVYIPNEAHTLASALRSTLEQRNPNHLVSCTHAHPLDEFMTVIAPSIQEIRQSLLDIRKQIAASRVTVRSAVSEQFEAPAGNTDEIDQPPVARVLRSQQPGL